MADQKRVQTSYDSGGSDTASKPTTSVPDGDWGLGKGSTDTKKQKSSDQTLLSVVLKDIQNARDYTKDFRKDWEDYWKCYNLERTRPGYQGISDDFVPESFTIIESIKANIAGGKPKFTFLPLREEQKQDTEIINNMIDFYWDQNGMTQKTLNWVQDMLLYGNGILYVSWDGDDDMPRIQNVPLADFFVDPRATHMNNPKEPGYPRYAGYEYLTDRETLERATILDPDTGEMTSRYKNLGDIPEYSGDWDKLDKETKDGLEASTLTEDEAAKTQVRCAVYFTKKKKIIVANKATIIYEGKNPYQREESEETVTTEFEGQVMESKVKIPAIEPFLPFAALRGYVDASQFYARGDMSVIIDRQETLNDISNQKQDNITYVLNNMWQLDPAFAHLADQIESVPGAVYPIPKGALAPIEKQVVTAEADIEMQRIKDEMRRATAADEVIQGVTMNKGRQTATEVTATVNQANQRFTTKTNTLEGEGYAQLGAILFKMVQIFVTQEKAVRILGPKGVEWKDYNPNDYTGEYQPKVTLDNNAKVLKAEEGQKFIQGQQVLMGSPFINQTEYIKMYLDKVLNLDEEAIKRITDVQQPMGMPGMMPGQGMPPMPGQGSPMIGSSPAVAL